MWLFPLVRQLQNEYKSVPSVRLFSLKSGQEMSSAPPYPLHTIQSTPPPQCSSCRSCFTASRTLHAGNIAADHLPPRTQTVPDTPLQLLAAVDQIPNLSHATGTVSSLLQVSPSIRPRTHTDTVPDTALPTLHLTLTSSLQLFHSPLHVGL